MGFSATRIALVGLVSLAIAMGVGRFAFTPLLPMMQADGLATVSEGGVLAAVHFLGYLLGAVVAAKIPGSPRRALRLSVLAIGLATFGMGVTGNFGLWLLFRWICGVSSAFILVLVSNYVIKFLLQNGSTTPQGWVFSGVGAGIAVSGLGALLAMTNDAGSVLTWQVFGAATLAVGLCVCAGIGPEVPAARATGQERSGGRAPLVWRMVIAYGTFGFGYIIPATFLPVMAREIVQSPLIFGWSWPVFGAAAFLSTVIAIRLERRFTTRQIWIASQFVMAAGLLLPAIQPTIAAINIAGICVGGTFMIITMAGMKESHRVAPSHDALRHIAVMTVAFAAGQTLGPLIGGAAYEFTGSFASALVGTSVLLAATAAVLGAGAVRPQTASS